ncbi:MAG: hypothetical protein NE328_22240 [Lentisphaeraceae bacterium]|nr:hypothetical protein [Lentisphaeraceae bacterium]
MGNIFFLVITIVVLSANNLLSQTAEKYFEMAKQVYPNYEKAVYFLTKAIYKDPKNADYHLARAKMHILSRELRDSEIQRDLEKTIELSPTNPYVYCWLLYYDSYKYKIYLSEVLEHGLRQPEVLNFFVKLISFPNQPEKNILTRLDEILNKLKTNPKTFRNAIAQIQINECLKKQIEVKKSFDELKKFTYDQLFADYKDRHFLEPTGIPPEETTIQYLYKTINQDFSNNYAFSARWTTERFYELPTKLRKLPLALKGRINPITFDSNEIFPFLKIGNYKECLKLINFYKKENPGLASILKDWEARCYSRMGLHSKAVENLETNLKSRNYLLPAHLLFIKALVEDQQFEKALTLAKELKFENEPENSQSILLFTYYITTHHYDLWNKKFKEIKKFQRRSNYRKIMNQSIAVRLATDKKHHDIYSLVKNDDSQILLDILFNQANSAIYQKNIDESTKWLNEAKRIDPDDCRHIFQEANLLFKTGEKEKALTAINKFLNQVPLNEKGIILKGMIQLELNQFKEAYITFGTLPNKRTAAYYRLIPLFCLGKYDHIEKACEVLIQKDPDIRTITMLHMIQEKENKEKADEILKKFKSKLLTASTITYSEYKLGIDSFEEYKKQMDYGPLLSVQFNFTIGFEAMQKGEKEKAIEHFKKCLIPYSIDLPEYHMAKACLKRLEK